MKIESQLSRVGFFGQSRIYLDPIFPFQSWLPWQQILKRHGIFKPYFGGIQLKNVIGQIKVHCQIEVSNFQLAQQFHHCQGCLIFCKSCKVYANCVVHVQFNYFVALYNINFFHQCLPLIWITICFITLNFSVCPTNLCNKHWHKILLKKD